MHKRSEKRLQLRRIRSILFSTCFYDKRVCEAVSRVSRLELIGLLAEPVEVGLVPDVEKGEVLVDSRGEGSFQRLPTEDPE
jgi:hypothetical protein